MPTTKVKGQVNNPDPIRSHDDFPVQYAGQTIAPGIPTQIMIRGAKNTGNVPQTVTVAIANVDGVQITGGRLEVGDTQIQGLQAVVNPGFYCTLYVTAVAPDIGIADDTEYSFDIVTTWQ
jgi:hypothetical protein